ncbi:MAG: hypothetical protein ACKOD8_11330, partial [Limnohabitans sp.]
MPSTFSAPKVSAWRMALMNASPDRADELAKRIAKQGPLLQNRLYRTYSEGDQVEALTEQLLAAAVDIGLKRSQELWDLDLSRQSKPDWHQQGAVGYTAYVDHFAGNL